LETGNRDYCSHVVRQKDIYLVFTSPLNPVKDDPIAQRIAFTGDAVKDVAFAVADVQGTITTIATKYLIFASDDEAKRLELGQSLREATPQETELPDATKPTNVDGK
jgi:hypothetical protein